MNKPLPLVRQRHSNPRATKPRSAQAKSAAIDADLFERILSAAVWHAKARRCQIERLLIDTGLMSDEQFYASLAAKLGVPFVPAPVRLDPTIFPHEALASGLAPVDQQLILQRLDTPAFIYAPQGAQLEWFIADGSAQLTLPGERIGITTPKTFLKSIRATFGTQIAYGAKWRLRRTSMRLSASSLRPTVWLGFLSAIAGLISMSIFLSTTFWHSALLLMTCFPILPGLLIKLMALKARAHGDLAVPVIAEHELPTYSVLVPVYREAAVLPQLIAALVALDYPRAKLEVKLLIESDDVETLAALDAVPLPAYFDVIICPRDTPRTKPRALTIGLAYTTSECVVVYDAEDIPEPDQLKKAGAIFTKAEENLACLQARLAIDNLDDSWFTRQFALEYAALFDVLLPGLAALNQPIPLGGTSNHFRRSALLSVAAWDPWNVTEDADLGLRLYRGGYRVKTFHSTTHEEAPANFHAWMQQRTRWLKGWMQTACVHLRAHGGNHDRMCKMKWLFLVLTACLSPLCILFHPLLILTLDVVIERLTDGRPGFATDNPVQFGFAILYLTSLYLDVKLVRWGAKLRQIPLGPVIGIGLIPYSLLKTAAAWRALIELIHAPYHWRKTAHGLAKTSRLISGKSKPKTAS